jgi:hypothetical protein
MAKLRRLAVLHFFDRAVMFSERDEEPVEIREGMVL